MREDNEKTTVDLGRGNGPLWTIAGTLIAMTAKEFLRPGVISGIFGGNGPAVGAPVTREVVDLTTENAVLKAQLPQVAINTKQSADIDCLQKQVNQLFGMTRLTIPNANLNPGYGPAFVTPGLPPPPPLDSATIQAIATAVAAQTAKEAA